VSRTIDVSQTICAVATPPGEGGVGIVRLSGPRALALAQRVFRPRPALPRERQLLLGKLADPATGVAFDDAFLVYMKGPRSYTAEDVVELHTHGSPFVQRRLIELLIALGAREAEPGEFTLRAFLNGRLDLTQAEAVHELITAESGAAAEIARGKLHGALRREVERLRAGVVTLLSQSEVNLDFVEEDVPLFQRRDLLEQARALAARIESVAGSYSLGERLRRGFRVVLAGRTNTGKSSLMNLLVGQARAIVSEEPGTTRDFIEARLEIDRVPVALVDTAGQREAAGAVEAIGVARADEQLDDADLVLLVLDRSCPVTPEDAAIAARLDPGRLIPVLNKCDLPPGVSDLDLALLRDTPPTEVSALTGEGLGTLKGRLAQRLRELAAPREGHVVVTRRRQHEALVAAHRGMASAVQELRSGAPLEVVAVPLYEALHALDGLLGKGTPDDVLEQVFSDFCIGK
jgi:tRNA modification GTPase